MAFDSNEWANKLLLKIDSSKIDGNLTDFPVLITLSSGTGVTDADVTDIFDQLAPTLASGTVFLLHYDGVNDSTNFVDSSSGNHIISLIGDPKISTAQYKFDGSSGYFDGTDGLECEAHANFVFGTGDFTLEAWIRVAAAPTASRIFATGDVQVTAGTWCLGFGTNWGGGTKINFADNDAGIHDHLSSAITLTANTLHHIRVVRDSGTIRFFFNGTACGTDACAHNLNASAILYTGCRKKGAGPDEFLVGYMDEGRILKGVAACTSDFTPSAGPYGTSWENRKKIALTTTISGVETECYVEIERWNTSTVDKSAELWTKVPIIVSGIDTDLYLYYDSSHADNTSYIGDTGDTPAQNVWDSDFKAVYHLSQDPNGDGANAIKDSTVNANEGTPGGTMLTEDLVDGKVGKGIDFDGGDDYITLGTNTFDGLTANSFTIEVIFKADTLPLGSGASDRIIDLEARICFLESYADASAWRFRIFNGSSWYTVANATAYATGSFVYLAGIWDKTDNDVHLYVNGGNIVTGNSTGTPQNTQNRLTTIGAAYTLAEMWFDGIIDEVRFSSTERSAAWIKATDYSHWNDIITFSTEFDPNEWANKLLLKIDSTKIDEDLTDFPVLIALSSVTGITNFDATDVFDILTTISGCEWNPADKHADIVLSNGDLTAEHTGSTAWKGVRSTFSKSTGKWYWEVKLDVAISTHTMIGIGTSSETLTYPGDTTEGYGYYSNTGTKWHSGSGAYGDTYTAGDVIGIALDLDNGKIWWAKNGVWQASGDPAAGTNEAYSGLSGTFFAMVGAETEGNKVTANFGATAFSYTAPTGFTAGLYEYIDNTKKIAITTTVSGVEIQLYTEIERWDWENGQAWLWTKVPTITSGTDTSLSFYYDSSHADNTSYIGDTGDTPAQSVWDDNFVGVYHLAQDLLGGVDSVLDSTSNENHATPQAGMDANDWVDGKIAKATHFDGLGTTDRLDIVTSANFEFGTNNFTIEHILYPEGNGTIFCNYEAVNKLHAPYLDNSTSAKVMINGSNYLTGITLTAFTFQQFYLVRTGNDLKAYIDDIQEGTTGNVTGVSVGADTKNYIGSSEEGSHAFTGKIDEVRISTNIARNAAWRKATYYSNWNDIITFSTEGVVEIIFTSPIPTHLSTVYGTSHTLQLTVTISGEDPSYVYDAKFFDASDDSQIGSTVSGINSGQATSSTMPMSTLSSGTYNWYLWATSSGGEDTSSTYSFTNRFLCVGTVKEGDTALSGIPVRLYKRDTGELIGSDISTGISGTFEIVTDYNEYHYAVAIYASTVSGIDITETNALIYDHLKP